MYKKFFGFTELPFQLVPNPAYLYLSKSHEEALAHLTYAISQGDGFVEITGEVGTGKTTLCRVFLDSLSDNSEAAYIFNPKLDSLQLLKAINDDFNLDSSKDNIKDLIDVLNDFLLKKKKEQKTILLIIDEAQNLAPEVLEQLRLLSNLETSTSKLLQIILVGQPELKTKFDAYELRQLKQRITLSCHILPLTFEETCEYIRHRIHIASGRPGVKFEKSALKAIYNYSKGVPRLINILSDRALLTGYVLENRVISGKTVRLAKAELQGKKEEKQIKRFILPVFSAAIMSVLIYLGISFFRQGSVPLPEPEGNAAEVKVFPVPKPEKKTEEAVSPPVEIQSVQEPDEEKEYPMIEVLDDYFSEHSRRIALVTALALWDVQSVINPDSDLIEDSLTYFKLGTKQNGMVVYKTEKEFPFLLTLNIPAILEFAIPGFEKPVYMVCKKVAEDRVILAADKGRFVSMAQDQIDIYWTGTAFLPWKNFLGLMGTIPEYAPEESVLSLKMLIREIGYSDIGLSSSYDNETRAAVREIQGKYGLEVDGTVGALTKIVIYNEAYFDKIPHLFSETEDAVNKQAGKLTIAPVELSGEDAQIPEPEPEKNLDGKTAKINEVNSVVAGDFVEIKVLGEHLPTDYKIFSIPAKDSGLARIVCDIPCLKGLRSNGEQVLPVRLSGVDKIRYFTYQGRMRVVVDISEEKIEMLSYRSSDSEITISIAPDQEAREMKIADGEIVVPEENEHLKQSAGSIEIEKSGIM